MNGPRQGAQPEGYEPFFGLHEPPFSLAPDPRFLYGSASHSAALDQVTYALERREPLVVITGEIGTGKTLLCRTVLQRLRRKTFLSVVSDPLLERDDLLRQLLRDFGVIPKDRTRSAGASRHELVDALQAFLRSLAPLGAHAVVIVDEAQHLQPAVLEQIRLLSNTDDERGTLLQIMLVGQMDLEALLDRPELRQLHQRVSRRLRLSSLSRDEVRRYIEHRLALARNRPAASNAPGAAELARELAEWAGPAAGGVEFTSDAFQAVFQLSGGLPRTVNLLCDRSLEEACRSRLHVIDHRVVDTAARALGVPEPPAPMGVAETLRAIVGGRQDDDDASFWTEPTARTAERDDPGRPADGGGPDAFAAARPAVSPRIVRSVALAAALAAAAGAAYLGVRSLGFPAGEPPPATAPVTANPSAPAARPGPMPAPANPATSETAATQATPEATTAAPPPAGTSAPPAERFDIVVASFRTDARAAAVADEISTLGLPNRRRVSDGWQQVVAGPFASRAEAEEAQQRLDRAGLTGTQLVAAGR